MMSVMPAASTAVGRSPSWSHEAATPTTGTASVPIPAAPAASARSANTQRTQHRAFDRSAE